MTKGAGMAIVISLTALISQPALAGGILHQKPTIPDCNEHEHEHDRDGLWHSGFKVHKEDKDKEKDKHKHKHDDDDDDCEVVSRY